MNDNVFWIFEVAIKPGKFDNFKAAMKDMIEVTQANEPNTMNYEWFISEDNKSCHVYEQYADSAAVMTHLGNSGGEFTERLMATIDPVRLVVYGNASDEVKEALSGFGAVHLTYIDGFAR